jgi:hypothetical protein
MLGYPKAAVADADLALEDARAIHASTLMFALFWAGLTNLTESEGRGCC